MCKKTELKRFLPALMLIALLALLTSCQTFPMPEQPDPVVIDWPIFPNPNGEVTYREDGTVIMPTDYWLKVTQYIIDVEAGIEIYEGTK